MFTQAFSTLSAFDKASVIAFWLTLSLLAVVIIVGVLVKKFKVENFKSYAKTSFAALIGYTVGMAANLMYLKLDEYIAEGYVDFTTFIPIVVIVGSVLILAIVRYIISIFTPTALKITSAVSGGIIALELLGLVIVRTVKYYKETSDITVSGEVQLYVYTVALIALVGLLAFVFGKNNSVNHTKSIAYAAITLALSFALSYIKFFELPQGGSVTLVSLLPLMIYSYMFGIRKGVLLCVVYSFLQFIQGPWFYHPVQFLLDYPIAFGAIGLSGLLNEIGVLNDKKPLQFALSGIIVAVIRYLSHVVSGIFVFGSGDPNYGAVAWSFLYNAFVFADIAITIVAGVFLFANKTFIKLITSAERKKAYKNTTSKYSTDDTSKNDNKTEETTADIEQPM